MNKFIAVMSLWTLTMLLGIGVMIYGWGLEPQSWWWIVGGGIFARAIVEFMSIVSKESKG